MQVSVSELSPWSLKGPLGAVIVFPSTHIMSAWCFLKHFEGSVAVVGSRRRFIPMTSGIACMSLWVFPVRRWLFETESLYVGICPPEVDQCDLVGSNLLLTWNWGRNVNGVQDCGPSYPSQADAIKLIWTKELPFCSQSCRWEVQWLAKPKLDQIVTLSWQELSRGQSVHHEEISMARWVTVVDLMSWICELEKGELFAD